MSFLQAVANSKSTGNSLSMKTSFCRLCRFNKVTWWACLVRVKCAVLRNESALPEDATPASVSATVQPEPSNAFPNVCHKPFLREVHLAEPHSLAHRMCLAISTVQTFRWQREADQKTDQKLWLWLRFDLNSDMDSLSYDIHIMLYNSWSGRLLIEKRKDRRSAHTVLKDFLPDVVYRHDKQPMQWYAH